MQPRRGCYSISDAAFIYRYGVVDMNLLGRFRIGERLSVLLAGVSVVLFLCLCLSRLIPSEPDDRQGEAAPSSSSSAAALMTAAEILFPPPFSAEFSFSSGV